LDNLRADWRRPKRFRFYTGYLPHYEDYKENIYVSYWAENDAFKLIDIRIFCGKGEGFIRIIDHILKFLWKEKSEAFSEEVRYFSDSYHCQRGVSSSSGKTDQMNNFYDDLNRVNILFSVLRENKGPLSSNNKTKFLLKILRERFDWEKRYFLVEKIKHNSSCWVLK